MGYLYLLLVCIAGFYAIRGLVRANATIDTIIDDELEDTGFVWLGDEEDVDCERLPNSFDLTPEEKRRLMDFIETVNHAFAMGMTTSEINATRSSYNLPGWVDLDTSVTEAAKEAVARLRLSAV